MYEHASISSSPAVAVAPQPADGHRVLDDAELTARLRALDEPLYAVRHESTIRISDSLDLSRLVGVIPALRPEDLGSRSFRRAHGLKYAYVTGAMAGGIASVDLVAAMAEAGALGFYGSGAVPLLQIEAAVVELGRRLRDGQPYGMNLLHNHHEPRVELETVELYLKHRVRYVEAAAFMQLTPAVVLYRAKGLRALADGRVVAPNRIFAKVSRPEVVGQFLAPAPEAILRELVSGGLLTAEEARLAARVPVADAVTAEGDSGGHTDSRPLTVLVPLMLRERDAALTRYGYAERGLEIHVGAAGGIGEPQAALAAFALGADYVVTGSINQASVQAGTSELVKRMLCEADMADVAAAPAPDMFELGARVQVLRRATLYPQRAQRLQDVYRNHARFEDVPQAEREKIERTILRRPFEEVWNDTERYWSERDPKQVEKARADGRLKMALTFRWYLGMSSRWPRLGDATRQADFQIWCGPAMGGFNRWVAGSALEAPEQRDAGDMARTLLRSTAALTRRDIAARLGVEGLPSAGEVGRP